MPDSKVRFGWLEMLEILEVYFDLAKLQILWRYKHFVARR